MSAILETTSSDHKSVALDKPILFIGRHPDCDLIINNSRKVSRKHCCLIEVEGVFFVRDLGSTNGIQVNDRKVRGLKELSTGDKITIGDCPFIFKSAEAIAEAYRAKKAAVSKPQQESKIPANDSDNDDSPYQFDLDFEANDNVPPVPNHELSSDIPILLDDPEDDGFDLGASPFNPANSTPRKVRKGSRSDSDSHIELIVE